MNTTKLKFDWDEDKARNNLKKHGISFKEAITVWNDEFAAFLYDPSHSIAEERYFLIGFSSKIIYYSYRLRKLMTKLD